MKHVDIFFEEQKKKHTENVKSKFLKTKNGRTVLLSKCVVSGSKKSRFLK